MKPCERYRPYGTVCLRPIVRLSPPCFSASASVATAMRVIECSSATTGSTERANVICTGPRTWPQLTPVDITAPKVRTSKKLVHIHCRAFSTVSPPPLRFLSSPLSASSAPMAT